MSLIKCGKCGIEIQSGTKQCPECGSTKKAFFEECTAGIVLRDSTIIAHKRKGFHKFMTEMITRNKKSKDKNDPQEVYEERIIDKEKGTYDQIVRNPKTGIIIHEEHMRLSEHRNNKQV
jgi:RNA polymerase subunit RPABC4/transcription elongation factor Spt4